MQAELLHILKYMPGHLYWKDVRGCYLGCNDRLAHAAGFSSEQEVVGKTDFELPWSRMAADIQNHDKQVMRSGLSIVDEERRVIADGTEIIFLTNKVPLYNARKKIIGLLGISLDITDYKKSEKHLEKEILEAERSNQAKSQLLTSISHELRTPITGILGMVRALNKVELPNQAKEFVNDIHITSEHLLSLVNDFLDVSKLESGKMRLDRAPLDFRLVIKDALIMLDYQARFKKLALHTFIDPDVPDWVMGDERAIKQIILNLMGNAIKFTEKGQVNLKINLIEKKLRFVYIQILVEDTGMGISQDKLAMIFDHFEEPDPGFSRRYGGTGLGLALCKNFVELMNGVIGVRSELGVGTQFYCQIPFALPLKKVRERKKVLTALTVGETETETQSSYRTESDFFSIPITMPKMRVLLVEDSPIVQKAHVLLLTELACQVEVVERADAALHKIQHNPRYDLVFMDLGLPDGNGVEVVQQVRRWEAQHQRQPLVIVALTAMTDYDILDQCLDSGMDAVVTKPILIDELRYIMNNLIK